MKIRKITSQFDKLVIEVLKCIVPDQHMTLNDCDGSVWSSSAISKNEVAITTIVRNDKVVAKIVYDYESGEEKEFIY